MERSCIMDTIKIEKRQVKMIAHRGLSGLEKENTHAAFVAAGNRSYFGIETDVHRTADGYFVLCHDDSTQRISADSMVVEDTAYEALTRLRLTDMDGIQGRRDLVIPDLADYIAICKKYGKVCVLELKNAFTPEDIQKIAAIIAAMGYLEQVIFISFNLPNLQVLRRLLPDQRIQYLLDEYDENTIKILRENRLDLDIRYTALTPRRIAALHDAGIEVNCWTVNDPEHAEALIAAGVDYITTNLLE